MLSGEEIKSAVYGAIHGAANFAMQPLFDLHAGSLYSGDLELSREEIGDLLDSIDASSQGRAQAVDDWIQELFGVDRSHGVYQAFRSGTTTGLELGSLAAAGYGALRGGAALYKLSRMSAHASGVAAKNIFTGKGAESVNAGVNLVKKLSQLETAQESAVNVRFMRGGRVRYYGEEKFAAKAGITRGRAYVTEFDRTTGRVRTWMVCYDHSGAVNRVHPKQMNGQELISPHYPPTTKELRIYE